MKILHISVAGVVDKFYYPFLSMIKERYEFEQSIYIPYKEGDCSADELKIISRYKENGVNPIALPIKTNSDRIFYKKKIHKYAKNVEKLINIEDYQIIHAHSLFSDGGVAYLLNLKYKIPYIVAVRITDILVFMKYFPHFKSFGRKILKNARKIIFITPSLRKDTIMGLYNKKNVDFINQYGEIIPNGINKFWINNMRKSAKKLENSNKVRLIQVSRMNRQKNVDKTIKAVALLRKRGMDVTLELLGEGEQRIMFEKLVADLDLENFITFYGFVSDFNKIKECYEKADIFVMPSMGETFGLTYIEAMSQGLPIIGVKNTGVSDFFAPDTVGCFVDVPTAESIMVSVEKIVNNYEKMSSKCLSSICDFEWEKIIDKYARIYEENASNQ